MAISISWYIPGRVILHKVTGAMGLDDIDEMERVMTANKPTEGRAFHQLIDITDMTKPPSIGMLRQRSRPAGDDDGFVIIIGKVNRMIEFIITSLAQITNFRVLVVPTFEEAITKLRHLDPSL